MDLFAKENLSFKILVEFLGGNGSQTLPEPDEWNRLENKFGQDIYSHVIYMLTQLEFSPEEGRKHWYAVLDHQTTLNKALNRDVGLRVALCDYFSNIEPFFQNLVFVEVGAWLQKERAAYLDDLTGIYNRRFFNEMLQKAIEHTKRTRIPFSLLMSDIDHFKEYNDRFGHKSGDQALVQVAQVLTGNARAIDHVVRYGGDEFAMILPQAEKQEALRAAERHRNAIENHVFPGEEKLESGRLTISIGVATYPVDAQDGLALFRRADDALYRGKDSRNSVYACLPDQRKSVRYPLVMDMSYRLAEEDSQAFRPGQTRDISLGGLLCKIDRQVHVGTPLHVALKSAGQDDALQLQAQAVRLVKDPQEVNSYYLGLSFQTASERESSALKELVERNIGKIH